MIYLVTRNYSLLSPDIICVSLDRSLNDLSHSKNLQLDTETDGCDPHVNTLLTLQLGIEGAQYVIDAKTIDITAYKHLLESRRIVGQNLKFDLEFLYNYGIVPLKVYDTMIAEQVLNLGYENYGYSLQAIAERRLGVYMDKSVRGQIRWRGLDEGVIRYSAKDVEHLVQIMRSQWADAKAKGMRKAVAFENAFVPVIAYLEWCGIHLDETLWKAKMEEDIEAMEEAEEKLNYYCLQKPELKSFIHQDTQGDLWNGYDVRPKCDVDWRKPDEVAKIASALGFKISDKQTIDDILLQKQKDKDKEFVKYYMSYKAAYKNVTTYSQNWINAINPKTGRVHTKYKQLAADSGRMSCGSQNNNDDLARLKGLPLHGSRSEGKACIYPNIQGAPHDEATRQCFNVGKDNWFISCDYSAMECRLAADIYHEQNMLKEYLQGSGDIYTLVAKEVFKDAEQRDKAKKITLAILFGCGAGVIRDLVDCSENEARNILDRFMKTFKDIKEYKAHEIRKTRDFGYILINPMTGHKLFWQGWAQWRQDAAGMTPWFWQSFKTQHQGTNDDVSQSVKEHFKEQALWDRKTLNAPTQGTGAIILKESQVRMFKIILRNGWFGKALLVNLSHDEADWEIPRTLSEFPDILRKVMEESARIYCKSLPIPAVTTIGNIWL